MPETELILKADGRDTDAVYENFVRQIAGKAQKPGNDDESLKGLLSGITSGGNFKS